ncbi:MAG: hypothetical protein PVG66_12855 [Chromatiales bacterium]|jgi:hypothetical protein
MKKLLILTPVLAVSLIACSDKGNDDAATAMGKSQPASSESTLSQKAGEWTDKTKELGSAAWDKTKETTADVTETVSEKSKEYYEAAKESTSEAAETVSEKSKEYYEAAKEGTVDAYESAKEKGSEMYKDMTEEKSSE